MKYLIFLVILTGCASVKKTTTHTEVKTDSLKIVKVDTVTKIVTVQQKRDLQISDFTFRINFANGDTATHILKSGTTKAPGQTGKGAVPAIDSEIAAAISGFITDHSQITSIDGHIGDIRDLTDYSSKSDSTGKGIIITSQVKGSKVVDAATTSKWHWPAWLTLLSIAVLLLVVLAILKKLKIFGL